MPGRPADAPTRVVLAGLFGADNLGDRAILEAIVAAASSCGAEVVAWTTQDPAPDPRAVVLRARRPWAFVAACRRADRVVMGGGGLLKDESLRFSLELLIAAVTGRLLRRRVTLLAVGAGPFYRRAGMVLVGLTARLAAVRTVRDEASAAALERLGVPDARVVADPVFSTPPPAPAARGSGRRILVAVRPWFHMDPDRGARRWAALRNALAEAIETTAAGGADVRLACLYLPEDEVAAREILARVRGERAQLLARRLTWRDMLEECAAADAIVAMRYHALVAAALARRPAVAIAYEPKVRSLAEELGVPIVEPDDHELARRVAEELEAGPPAPDEATVDRLRRRAEAGLRAALSG
ncbi:MAG TPA: polysaccharide pyruvyl transferase family protein [Solirubrobacteraceae bacterium]|nr:polysaccharide pyruvyl transferase family protein [Solirubrobacteraceae bacterium]